MQIIFANTRILRNFVPDMRNNINVRACDDEKLSFDKAIVCIV